VAARCRRRAAFLRPDDVKRHIDFLAYYKFNHRHLHLSDDQAGASKSRPGRI
jgi:N-acetyl-beta-hexosaminidase